MNRQELELLNKLNNSDVQQELENLRKLTPEEDALVEDNRTLEEIIREVAEEEGMTYEETLALFKQGVRKANGLKNSGLTAKQKAKAKKKKKMAKASKKRNR